MWGKPGESWQDDLQLVIMVVAVLCIPTMLIPKPVIEIRQLKRLRRDDPLRSQDLEDELIQSPDKPQPSAAAPGHSTSEIVVDQLIETIEFALGCVSNTASYLRLWALSLAHSQLAIVFFNKTLEMGYGTKAYLGVPMMIVLYWILALVTFGVLMCMDAMECFLHSLRLHWVEFQNKFYKGDGCAYAPFSFQECLLTQKAS